MYATEIMDGLLNGDRVGVVDESIADFVRNGQYAEPHVRTVELEQDYKDMWLGGYVGIAWGMERSYIVESDAIGGCDQDHRGPEDVKVCLEEHPNMVYHMYFVPRVREGSPHQALLRGPPNHLRLKEFGNITLKDVVRASLAHRATMEDKESVKRNVMETYLGHLHEGGRFHGLFRLPICRNPGGETISSVMSEDSRNYPCMCGNFDWHDGPSESGDNDETNKFLIQTGLWASGDWVKRCDERKPHNCHEGKRHWKFPGKTKHSLNKAWIQCGHAAHRYMGYELIGDDGHSSRDDPPPPPEEKNKKTGGGEHSYFDDNSDGDLDGY